MIDMSHLHDTILTAPQIDGYISYLRNNKTAYNENLRRTISELFAELQKIAPSGENGGRELFFEAERGKIEDYGDFEDMLANGDIASREEFEQLWHEEYPQESKWYHFAALETDGYMSVWLGHNLVIQVAPHDVPTAWGMDIEEFAQWLLHATKSSINALKNGTYNESINRNLPAYCRTGTISRKKYWDVFPEYRAAYLADLSDSDAKRFTDLMSKESQEKRPQIHLPQMTSGLFYHCCSLGYKANNYEGCDNLSPKNLYLRYADGRDEGLRKLREDSPEEFSAWYFDRSHAGGHPWEICRGGNSTHVSLYIMHDDAGFYFCVAGKSYGRSVEAIKFYLALASEGIPVMISDGQELVARINETDKIGILPMGVTPSYFDQWFCGEKILDAMNLPHENEHLVAKHAVWQPIPIQKFIVTVQNPQPFSPQMNTDMHR